jgi:hypothetical protein
MDNPDNEKGQGTYVLNTLQRMLKLKRTERSRTHNLLAHEEGSSYEEYVRCLKLNLRVRSD